MILSDLNHTERLEKEHPLFKQLFDYIRANDLLNAPLGRIELDGDRLFINNCETQGNPAEKQRLEAHRVYADVHVLLEGEETLGWSNTDDLREEDAPYNAEDDIVFSESVRKHSSPCVQASASWSILKTLTPRSSATGAFANSWQRSDWHKPAAFF